MEQIWNDFRNALRKIAGERVDSLAPGATEADIADLEARIGIGLPEEVRQTYAIHNGSNGTWIFPHGEFLSLKELHTQWTIWRDLLQGGTFGENKSNPKGPIKPVWWNLRWIPFTHNGGGDHQCIDLDPASGGTLGQVFDFGHETGPTTLLAPSLGAFLSEYTAKINAGQYFLNEDGMIEEKK